MAKRKKTEWMKHLESVRKRNPEMSLSSIMKKASKTYKKK